VSNEKCHGKYSINIKTFTVEYQSERWNLTTPAVGRLLLSKVISQEQRLFLHLNECVCSQALGTWAKTVMQIGGEWGLT
jgi:hypothetical protein